MVNDKMKAYQVRLSETRVYHKIVTVYAPDKAAAQRAAMERRGIKSESQLLIGKSRLIQAARKVKG